MKDPSIGSSNSHPWTGSPDSEVRGRPSPGFGRRALAWRRRCRLLADSARTSTPGAWRALVARNGKGIRGTGATTLDGRDVAGEVFRMPDLGGAGTVDGRADGRGAGGTTEPTRGGLARGPNGGGWRAGECLAYAVLSLAAAASIGSPGPCETTGVTAPRFQATIGEMEKVLETRGDAHTGAGGSSSVDEVEPHLCMRALRGPASTVVGDLRPTLAV
mmetsp:Transcript_23812/g.77419  ORF Transcript_23812/g.77419 Transcript_23812/m.77419 type:complete len:217 (-) Transcript_23812:2292-2942(-)